MNLVWPPEPPWRLPHHIAARGGARHTVAAMEPDEMQRLLESHNVGFTTKDMPHGRQFRLKDGAIANVYSSGRIVWQGKETDEAARIKGLCGEGAPALAA